MKRIIIAAVASSETDNHAFEDISACIRYAIEVIAAEEIHIAALPA